MGKSFKNVVIHDIGEHQLCIGSAFFEFKSPSLKQTPQTGWVTLAVFGTRENLHKMKEAAPD